MVRSLVGVGQDGRGEQEEIDDEEQGVREEQHEIGSRSFKSRRCCSTQYSALVRGYQQGAVVRAWTKQ